MITLVTGSGGPAAINALRFLPKETSIVACDADPGAEEKGRKTGRDFVFYTVPLAGDPGFLDKVKDIAEKESVDIIIPTVDEDLPIFSRNMSSFRARVMISPQETVETCDDKARLYEKLKDSGISPEFLVTDKREDLLDFQKNQKIFMKPRVGRGSRGIEAFDRTDLVPEEKINKKNIFCEYLPGREYTIDTLCDLEGNLVVAIPRIRMSTDRGISVHGKTEKNQEILKKVAFICNTLKFIGHINIQFKLDSQGIPKLVEINPRLSGGFPLTVASGVNTLELLYKLLKGEKINPEELEWKETESRQERP
jgi:carbamoyl-phosphate synthase large subunit